MILISLKNKLPSLYKIWYKEVGTFSSVPIEDAILLFTIIPSIASINLSDINSESPKIAI